MERETAVTHTTTTQTYRERIKNVVSPFEYARMSTELLFPEITEETEHEPVASTTLTRDDEEDVAQLKPGDPSLSGNGAPQGQNVRVDLNEGYTYEEQTYIQLPPDTIQGTTATVTSPTGNTPFI